MPSFHPSGFAGLTSTTAMAAVARKKQASDKSNRIFFFTCARERAPRSEVVRRCSPLPPLSTPPPPYVFLVLSVPRYRCSGSRSACLPVCVWLCMFGNLG